MNVRFSAESSLDQTADLLIVATGEEQSPVLGELNSRLHNHLNALLEDRKFKGKAGQSQLVPTYGHTGAAKALILGIGSGSADELAKAAAKAGFIARSEGASTIAFSFGDIDSETQGRILEYFSVGNYRFDKYLSDSKRTPEASELVFCGMKGGDADAVGQALIRARYQTMARDLVNSPADDIYPETLANRASTLGDLPGVTVEVWDFDTCREKGLVGIEAVGRGSARPGVLIKLSYRPENPQDHIALVGKGVTFDAGGLSLKPSNAMQTMRSDMGGAATAIAAFGAIAELGLPIAVDAWIPSVENMNDGNSFKLGDILSYNNGVSVEIHNTDAEGRLILADALILASETPGVSRVVDLATLTGAVIVALGPDYTGLFTQDDGLAAEISDAASDNSELVWRLPLFNGYNRMLKGTWSDIKNVGGRAGGSITAALYLQHFVKEGVRWAHLDIAGSSFADAVVDGYAKGGTGQVVRTLVTWAKNLSEG